MGTTNIYSNRKSLKSKISYTGTGKYTWKLKRVVLWLSEISMVPSLKLTCFFSENQWLEDDIYFLGPCLFSGTNCLFQGGYYLGPVPFNPDSPWENKHHVILVVRTFIKVHDSLLQCWGRTQGGIFALPKSNSLHLNMVVGKITFLLGFGLFSGANCSF